MYIEKIKEPNDTKQFDDKQLEVLAEEIRNGILNRVSAHGGHVVPTSVSPKRP